MRCLQIKQGLISIYLLQIQQIEENNLSFTTWLNFLEYLDGSDSSFDFELLKAMNEG